MRRLSLIASLACLAHFVLEPSLAAQAGLQPAPKVIRIRPFSGDALASGELSALQKLVASQVVELRSFRVIDAEGQDMALAEAESAMQLGVAKDVSPLAADYLLSAEAMSIGDFIVFTMELTKVTSGEKRSAAETFSSVKDLILASKRLTLALFDREAQASSGAATAQANVATAGEPVFRAAPSLADATGVWSGDKGIGEVSLAADGRGIATLQSGVKMKVRAAISGSTLIVVQDQPNIPDFYTGQGITPKSARTIAKSARPWRWIFSMTIDGNSLIGIKESVFVSIDPRGNVKLDNSYSREALWVRRSR